MTCNTNAPSLIGVPADVTLNCNTTIPSGSGGITAIDPDLCASSPNITYVESIVYHTNANWKYESNCAILYTISNISYEDQGTASTIDDTFDCTLTIIGRNGSSSWNTTINGILISGNYQNHTSLQSIPVPASGLFAFTISDMVDASCQTLVNFDISAYQ